jgi:hypothetical protein
VGLGGERGHWVGGLLGEKSFVWGLGSTVDARVAEEKDNFLRRPVVVVDDAGECSEFAVIGVSANVAGCVWWHMRLGHNLR